MQIKSSNCIEADKRYIIIKRFYEILISCLILIFTFFIFNIFLLKKLLVKKEIFQKKRYFHNKNKTFEAYIFNTNNDFIKYLPLFYYILISKISLIGITLVQYEKNINYDTNKKPGFFSLWKIRQHAKMPNISISSCNKEYENKKNTFYDFKILIKSIISLMYIKNNTTYQRKIKIFDVLFDNLKNKHLLSFINNSIKLKMKKVIYFVNADCLNKTYKNKNYKNILKKANLILPDGSGINLACNILNKNLLENLNGTDLFPYICSLAQKKSYKIFLFGAENKVCEIMKKNLEKKYPKLLIVGINHGYLNTQKEEKDLIKKINASKTNILFVALGAPKQEEFINKYKKDLNVNILLAVGGLFDFYSNKNKRAPLFLRELGFEWIYRMMQEPKRMWKRYVLGNPLFIYRVLRFKKEENILINTYLHYDNKKTKINNIFWKLSLIMNKFLKRIFDILISFILLLLLSPLFLLTAIIIKISSKGDIFYIQKRVGLKGKIFKMYKFRSMIQNAHKQTKDLEQYNESKDNIIFKIKKDPRITRFGSFIRKTSIDELPQLLNVLKANMSLVGPRPPLHSEVVKYSLDDKKRLDVKPGITCIWQVSGRSDIPFKMQVKMDKKYIKSQSFKKDIILLLKTIPAVLFQKGSY